MNDMHSSERWIISALLAVALLTFFFPLVTLQIPILGNQDVSGYDLVAKARAFNQTLDAVKSKQFGQSGPESVPSNPNPDASSSSMPLSVQTLSLIPIEITAIFACALIALLCCVGQTGSTSVKGFSSIGNIAAVATVLHLTVANSDLHAWFQDQMKADSPALARNPFAGLARQIETIAANSFQLKPGAGLYVLAATLSLATMFLYSKILSGSPLAEPSIEVNPARSNGRERLFVFFALLLAALIISFVVLKHTPQAGTASPKNAVRTSPSAPQESDTSVVVDADGIAHIAADVLITNHPRMRLLCTIAEQCSNVHVTAELIDSPRAAREIRGYTIVKIESGLEYTGNNSHSEADYAAEAKADPAGAKLAFHEGEAKYKPNSDGTYTVVYEVYDPDPPPSATAYAASLQEARHLTIDAAIANYISDVCRDKQASTRAYCNETRTTNP
jgi:hypothetical protein